MYKEQMISDDGVMYKKKIVEVLSGPSTDKKAKTRFEIENQVFDLHDSVADTTKWLSLLSSMVARIYSNLPESQKAKIPTEERAFIEYALNKFNSSTTRADIQYAEEGTAMVDKIFARQTQIAEIIK